MTTQRLLRDVLRWARANDWRPLYPRNRRDGLYSWTNVVRDPGNRRQSTLRVSVDVSGRVEVHQRMTDGWVAIGWFWVGAGHAVVDILAAMCVLPKEFSTEYQRGREDAAEEKTALLDALRRLRDSWYHRPHWSDAADAVDVLIDDYTEKQPREEKR